MSGSRPLELTLGAKQRVCLCDLPDEEFNSLMDMHATGRLSWLVEVIRYRQLVVLQCFPN
jgi:hypothetical protein